MSNNRTKIQKIKEGIPMEQYFQILMDNIPDMIYFKNRESEFTLINKAQAALLGVESPDEAIGKKDSDYFETDHANQAFREEQDLMNGGETVENKIEYVNTPNGNRYISTSKVPIFINEADCIGIVGISRDVHDAYMSEEELRNEKKLLDALLNNIPDRIYFKDRDSKFIRANKGIAELFGTAEPEDLYGKTDFNFHDPEHAREAFKDEQELMKNGTSLVNKLECHIDNGTKAWELTTKVPLFDEEGSVTGVVGISRDFTQQKQLEETLAKEKDLLQVIMDNIPDLVFFKDLKLRYTAINRALADIGDRCGETNLIGKTAYDIYPEKIASVINKEEQKVIKTGKATIDKIGKRINTDGSIAWYSSTRMPVSDINGMIIGLVGISKDVTAQELTKQKLQLAKEKAQEASRAKSMFLANMSHEIRTPMNGVIGMADILQRTELSAEQNEYLEIIMKSGQTLLSLIDDILDFSKIESGKLVLETEPINIRNIIEEVADVQSVFLTNKPIDIVTYIDPDIPSYVKGDYVRLKQVLTNLINNAVKFTEKGELFITAEYVGVDADEHEIKFEVKDTGIGIPPEKQDKLFKPFSQVDASTTRIYGGTGLGLAICFNLVDKMNGKLKVRSEEGKGATFYFKVKFGTAKEKIGSYLKLKNIAQENLNIMVVDDNATNRKIFKEYLDRMGIAVFGASNGQKALKKLTKLVNSGKRIDLVLVDFQMPHMDGTQLAKEIKSNDSLQAIPLVLLSSVTDVLSATELKKTGFEYSLSKPVKLNQLYNVIATVIGGVARENKPRIVGKIDANEFKDYSFLIAEDNLVNMRVAQLTINKLSNRVFTASNGQEAVDAFIKEKPDFILMDMQMPVKNGVDATIEIRSIEKQEGSDPIRIIAMTANTFKEDIEKCMNSGMNAFLEKPFKVDDLINVLREVK